MQQWNERTYLLLGRQAADALAAAHVVVVGVGGVGAYAAEMIARAGVGRMTLVDGDVVSESNINLHRGPRQSGGDAAANCRHQP